MLPQTLNSQQQDALQSILNQINSQDSIHGLKEINEIFLNALMKKERDVFLRYTDSNKANGYYDRTLASGLGKIDLVIPRDRLGQFRPFLLPDQWQRGEQTYDDLLKSLVFHAYSPNKIRSILHSLGLPYSIDDIEELKNELYQRSLEFKSRQLDENVFCLYIDAYHTQLKDPETSKIDKAVIHTVIGIDLRGKKEIYGYYEFMGSENRTHWLRALNDLIKRGLKRILVIVSDDFPGLTDAVQTLFPKTDHQLCFIHLQRNVRRNLGKQDAKVFNDALSSLKMNKNYDAAKSAFNSLCTQYQDKYPSFIEYIQKRSDHYFAFLQYSRSLQKHIYTTNIVENVNSRLEVLRVNLGGYFQSSKTLNVAVQVLVEKLQADRWRKALPAFLENEYEVLQLFKSRFAIDSVQ